MAATDTDRAVTPIIGAILLAGILVFLLAIVQVSGVPAWNKQTEAEHSRTVLGDMQVLQSSLLAVAADGNQRVATVRLGTAYQDRPPLRNPPDPSGTIRTSESVDAAISNAVAAGETQDYWDGSQHDYSTQAIEYQSNYNYFDNDDLVIESGVLYKRFDSGVVTHSEQKLIRGNRITLLVINGSLSESGDSSRSLGVVPVSTPAQSVSLQDTGSAITIEIPTNLPESNWRELLADEETPNGYITNISYVVDSPANRLILTLEQNVTYDVRLAKVGLGSVDADTATHYVIRRADRFVTADSESRAKLAVEVRDRYDNPVSNANVTFDSDVGDFEDEQKTSHGRPATVQSDDDGIAVVWHNVSGSLGVHEVRVDINDTAEYTAATDRERLEFTIVNPGGSGADSAEAFVLLNSVTPSDSTGMDTYESLTLSMENDGSTALSVIGFQTRFVLVSESGDLLDGPTAVSSITLDGDTKTVDASETQQPVFFESSPLTFPRGTTDLKLTFDSSYRLRMNQDDAVGVRFTIHYEGGFSTSFTVWEFEQ